MTSPQYQPDRGGRGGGPGGRGPRRPPPRRVEVLSVEHMTPRLLSVTVGGEAFEGFRAPLPTAHIKLFLPGTDGVLEAPVVAEDGMVDWPNGRPTMRTYTPRRFDAESRTMEIQLVLHGDGPASQWAAKAAPGDLVAIGGPGGGLEVEPSAQRWVIAADLSALPAAAMLVESLPDDAHAQVHVEVDDESDRIDVFAHPGADVTWHVRDGDGPGALLEAAVRSALLEADTRVWAACEASAVRRIRSYVLRERGHGPRLTTTRGYWRVGAANHPDHDFGED